MKNKFKNVEAQLPSLKTQVEKRDNRGKAISEVYLEMSTLAMTCLEGSESIDMSFLLLIFSFDSVWTSRGGWRPTPIW